MPETIRTTLAALVGIVAVAALLVGLYLGTWWLREDSVNRDAEIRRDSFERQETLRDELLDQAADLGDLDVQLANPSLSDDQRDALRGQREAMRRQLCSLAADITGDLTPTIDNTIRGNC